MEILVLAEHRRGELREVSLEMLSKAHEIAEKIGAETTAVLLGSGVKDFADTLANYANKVLLIDDAKLENFNAESYQKVLSALINERNPAMTMIGHSAFGMDLAPALAVELDLPLATDCIDLEVDGSSVFAIRQIYSGKVNVKVSFNGAEKCMVTMRASACPVTEGMQLGGTIETIDSPLTEDIDYKVFSGYEEAAAGDVDITVADILVGVGRGIGDPDNLEMVEELAKAMGGVVACSRPVVDKKWLPKDRQVGTSGKTVKPKLYLAVGISGAFQHLAGMNCSDLIIAINKDPKAPIFAAAQYGIVADLFKVVPALKDKINELI